MKNEIKTKNEVSGMLEVREPACASYTPSENAAYILTGMKNPNAQNDYARVYTRTRVDSRGREFLVLNHEEAQISDHPQKGWDSKTSMENLVYQTGDLIIDRFGEIVYQQGEMISLSPTEFRLILFLVEHPYRFCPRKILLEIAEERFDRVLTDNTLSKHIHRTRSKLSVRSSLQYVVTRNSSGYKWNLPVKRRYLIRKEVPFA